MNKMHRPKDATNAEPRQHRTCRHPGKNLNLTRERKGIGDYGEQRWNPFGPFFRSCQIAYELKRLLRQCRKGKTGALTSAVSAA